MSRYAYHSQEVLYRDGKLIGFNAGYGFYAEHESKYRGVEQRKIGTVEKSEKNPFDGEIIENPDEIHLIEFDDGKVWIISNSWYYDKLMRKTYDEQRQIMEKYINNDDRSRTEQFLSEIGANLQSPEVVALWNAELMGAGGSFNLISTNEQSSEMLKKLYDEMKKGNVAISSDYSFLFKDRGLSFVLLDQLTNEDLLAKRLVDDRDELIEQFQKEYREYLTKEGLHESVCYVKGGKYSAEFWNVQIRGLKMNTKRRYST